MGSDRGFACGEQSRYPGDVAEQCGIQFSQPTVPPLSDFYSVEIEASVIFHEGRLMKNWSVGAGARLRVSFVMKQASLRRLLQWEFICC